ncbi:hypothetical protein QMG83_03940 [Salinibacterium sp. G-O1]|uniref:hypothetical protein n=1 Tax=Salinibacterium sp. G-O1 TaxID=3046208 RepID=UPI0024BBBE15|nr:hypothetical protein [Salinibacterium sp. G-O1]MDJ0334367.1 hypothetical protein [Salinibacterium sp. G-O1]
MYEFLTGGTFLLLGVPIVAAIIVGLVFTLFARKVSALPLAPAAALRMNDDGSLSEVVEQQHALAA